MPCAISGGASMTETAREAARRLTQPWTVKGYVPRALHTYRTSAGDPIYYRVRLEHPGRRHCL